MRSAAPVISGPASVDIEIIHLEMTSVYILTCKANVDFDSKLENTNETCFFFFFERKQTIENSENKVTQTHLLHASIMEYIRWQ